MCVAIEEMRMDSRLEGEIEGAVKTYKEVGFSLQDTIRRISDNHDLSMEESKDKVTKYWK